jgi:hypothetical protein
MSANLTAKSCTRCRGGVLPLSRPEARRYGAETSDWALVDDLCRRFELSSREARAYLSNSCHVLGKASLRQMQVDAYEQTVARM